MKQRFQSAGALHEIELAGEGRTLTATIDGLATEVELLAERPGELVLSIGGRILAFDFAADESGGWLCGEGRIFRFDRPKPVSRRQRESAERKDEVQRSPMPALVISVEVAEGQEIEGGKTLLVIEAMKMETRVSAPPGSWRVARIFVAEGQQVSRDEELIELAPRPKAGDRSGGGDDR